LLAAPILLLIALQASPPSEEFERGRIAFERHEYARAIEILRPLLYPELRLESEGEIAQAHRMLGVAHLFEQQNEMAAQEFRKLLQLRPSYRMEPLLDPPQVVDFFNAVLKQQESELADLERKRQDAEAEQQRRLDAARDGPGMIERHYIRNSFAVNFLPFGAGQFQNGQRRKGVFFLTTESILAGISVGALTTNFALYGFRPRIRCVPGPDPEAKVQNCMVGQVPSPDQARSQMITKVQIASGALFFATALWGVVDAVVHFRPTERLPTGGSPPAGGPAVQSPRLAPAAFGAALGASLSFRF
jgi:hypothetical protein